MSRIHAPDQEPTRKLRPSADSRRRRPRSRGQALVEFAVVLPVFLLILAGVIDFGLGLYSQMTVINAAREGARYAVVNTPLNTSNVTNPGRGDDRWPRPVAAHGECLLPGRVRRRPQSGDTVVGRVDYDYHMLWPLAFGNTIDLSSTVQMRIE